MYDFTLLLSAPTTDLLRRFAEVAGELANLHEELAMLVATERREVANAMLASGQGSSSGRRDHVTMHVVEPTCTRIELEGRRDALVEEKFFLRLLLEGGHHMVEQT